MSALSERLETLTPEHRAALEWFETQRGELVSWPKPLNGLLLMSKPKGIRRPKGWAYALSVRQTLTGTYADSPLAKPDGAAWTYDYFQEGKDPSQRDKYSTNRGLMACMKDDVPVAVLVQEQVKPSVKYRVRGLAKVVDWDNGHFKLQGYDAFGNVVFTKITDEDAPYVSTTSLYGDLSEAVPEIDLQDYRTRINAEIVVRAGSKHFRDKALANFKRRCAISNWEVEQVLEAAHIVPHLGDHTDREDNALLLRADLHTLFDRELLDIDPTTLKVQLAPSLRDGPYAYLAERLVEPADGVTVAAFKKRLLERAKFLKSKST